MFVRVLEMSSLACLLELCWCVSTMYHSIRALSRIQPSMEFILTRTNGVYYKYYAFSRSHPASDLRLSSPYILQSQGCLDAF
jgi:hypothetical protein